MKPLLIAHRGDTIHFSENTIEAFDSAFKLGSQGIECDVQCLDQSLIVVHDYLFDRHKTYPRLSEMLRLFAAKGRMEIEVKSMDLEFLPELQQLRSQYKRADIEFTTSFFPIIPFLRQTFDHTSLGVIFSPSQFEEWMTEEFIATKITKTIKLLKAQVAHIPWKQINKDLVEKLHQEGVRVHTHIGKEDYQQQTAQYRQMTDLKIDQATFDDINLLQII